MSRVLVTGGVRSGKSALAESVAAATGNAVCYVATATRGDGEMSARIRQHQARRPAHWDLLEVPLALGAALDGRAATGAPALLVDCMSLWLSNLLCAEDDTLMEEERAAFLAALGRYPGDVVVVSNEVGLGLIGMDPLSRRFADELGHLNQALAAECDTVVLTVAGLPMPLKGALPAR